MAKLSFEPSSTGTLGKHYTSEGNERTFIPLAQSHFIGNEEVGALQALIESPQDPFPISAQNTVGRSVYITTGVESDWRLEHNIEAIKLKGGFGLIPSTTQEETETFELVLPSPKTPFYESNHWHIRLDEELSLTPVASTPKGLHTLNLAGALREMECHNALASCDAGLPGLLAGRLDQGGSPILDLNDTPTGAVYIQHDPGAQMLWGYMMFEYTEVNQNEAVIKPPPYGDFHFYGGHPLKDLVENYCYFMGRLGEIKSRAIFDAGIMRHSSHAGNFLFNDRVDRMLQMDNDTCLRSSDLSPELRGAQLLRDVCSTLQRLVTDLSMCAYSPDWRSYLKYSRSSPFHAYLHGIFGRFVSDERIRDTAYSLQRHFSRFTTERADEFLTPLADRYREAGQQGDEAKKEDLLGRWSFIHNPFLAESIRIVYDLCHAANFPKEYKIPKVEEASFFYRLNEGISDLRDRIMGRVPTK